jgi:serine protease Do
MKQLNSVEGTMKKLSKVILFFTLGISILSFNCSKKGDTKSDLSELDLSNLMIREVSGDSGLSRTDEISNSRRNAITQAVEKVSPAVVGINVTQIREYIRRSPFSNDPFFRQFWPDLRFQERVKSLGSGFIISPDGYLLTNEHVVNQATEVIVTLSNGKKSKAELVGSDYITDIALLKINGETLPYVHFGDSNNIIIGEWVIALGNPFGLFDINAKPTVTVGVVSAVDRDFGRQSDDRVYQDMIQTDAAINGGNSGGPLVNSLGEVIGINTFIFSGSESISASIGLGFAIPINRVKRVLQDLKKHGEVNRRFWTGLEVENLNPLIARFLGLKSTEGVIISDIKQDSPAARANLEVGDVIAEVNGESVRNIDDIWAIIEDFDAKGGDSLTLTIFRKGKYFEATIKLEELPG